ncbi:MAG TPA: hypothetical protein DCL54_07955 [Alphaproteobacteria bacterium]|nr:hypothetical protein [Alphaproteobacteria bacterium]HAJ46498.1 hypothetical protein [Alphaproteobacteria bacterium]
MKKVLGALGLGVGLLMASAPAALAGHCYDGGYGCRERCPRTDCCARKVCHDKWGWETRKVFDGYREDCYGCRTPVYRYERVRVYLGKHCEWVRSPSHNHYTNGDYSHPHDAFPGYRTSY